MARSLRVSCESIIEFDNQGIEVSSGKDLYEINVEVDGQKNNGSFTVTSIIGDWYSYKVERLCTEDYVKIILRVQKNLSRSERIGLIRIEHNCANISEEIEIHQFSSNYSLTAKYKLNEKGWIFKSVPSELFEEKEVILQATNGRGKWYVKEIQQYQVLGGDNFDDLTEEYKGFEEQDEQMNQVKIPYDGVFNYRIEDDRLIVKSFGQIDLITNRNQNGECPHMRYFFLLSHCDVSNSNKIPFDDIFVGYEERKLFVFDGSGAGSQKYEEGGDPSITPSEGYTYIFTVNDSKAPLINVDEFGDGSIMPIVVSTKNGSNLAYTAKADSTATWCVVKSNGTLITVPPNFGNYRECIVEYTQTETNEVIKLKITQDSAQDIWIFEVNGKTESFTLPQFSPTGERSSIIYVDSRHGGKSVAWGVYQQYTANWARFENSRIIVDENNTSNERRAVFVFLQLGGSRKSPIYVTVIQKKKESQWIFTVTPSSKKADPYGETIHLSIISQCNGEFTPYSVQNNSDKWLYFDKQTQNIVVSGYSFDEEGTSRNSEFIFIQDESNEKQNVKITQDKQIEDTGTLVFVDGEIESKTLTLDFDENGSSQTIVIKSVSPDGLPDDNISVVNEFDKWSKLGEIKVLTPTYYTTSINCETNTSSERQQDIIFTNSSEQIITLTVKQSGKQIVNNTITFKAGTNVDKSNQFELYLIYSANGTIEDAQKVETILFTSNTDTKIVKIENKNTYFLVYNSGQGEGDLIVTQQLGGSVSTLHRIAASESNKVAINNKDGEIVTIDVQQNLTYVYYLEDDTLTLGYSGGYYSTPYAKVYSYGENDTSKIPIDIKNCIIKDGDFINRVEFSQTALEDENGYYYKITVDVSENLTEYVRNGHITIINKNDEQLELKVVQRVNGEILFTKFDYIVMNYNWIDARNTKGEILKRDFDCVMYIDTPEIGNMYEKTAYFNDKEIKDNNNVTYAELAYDQRESTAADGVSCIETQVVYLKKLQDDNYLDELKKRGVTTLRIVLYGNMFNTTQAQSTNVYNRNVTLTMHTYLGGEMVKDDVNLTMKNIGGQDKQTQKMPTYYLTSMKNYGGTTASIAKTFDYMGVIEYNIIGKTAVFTPNKDLYSPK